MPRLAALVPRPRLHLIRVHEVRAPKAKLRPQVVRHEPPVQPVPATEAAAADECEVDTLPARPKRISWPRLLQRVFGIDMQHCRNCGGGELKVIAAIPERPVIEKILTHPGLDAQPPPRGRAREVGAADQGRTTAGQASRRGRVGTSHGSTTGSRPVWLASAPGRAFEGAFEILMRQLRRALRRCAPQAHALPNRCGVVTGRRQGMHFAMAVRHENKQVP